MKTEVLFVVENLKDRRGVLAAGRPIFTKYEDAEAEARRQPGVYEIHKLYVTSSDPLIKDVWLSESWRHEQSETW